MPVGGHPDALTPFFAPRGVAVVGASRDPAKVGGSVLANLRGAGFEGRIWPVNPRTDIVQGLPATASLLAISEPVDLAVLWKDLGISVVADRIVLDDRAPSAQWRKMIVPGRHPPKRVKLPWES